MEDIYVLLPDCVCNLSSLFTFYPLLLLSTTSKCNSKYIFELTIHSDQPIYYSRSNQIKQFHRIHQLTIPKYCHYSNLSSLTHIKNIIFQDSRFIDVVTNLTHLTTCHFLHRHNGINKYFHINLTKSYDFVRNRSMYKFDGSECVRPLYRVSDIIKLTHLTHIDVFQLTDCNDINQLLAFTNLKSLNSTILKNIFNLSRLISLTRVNIDYLDNSKLLKLVDWKFENVKLPKALHNDSLIIDHPNITNVRIANANNIIFQNCYNLKRLELQNFISCKNNIYTQLQTVILIAEYENRKACEFDINQCVNLKYFKQDCREYGPSSLESHLTKLDRLYIGYQVTLELNKMITSNLTYLHLNACTNTFDFIEYSNLKNLSLNSIKSTNLRKLKKLENLKVDCKYCTDSGRKFSIYVQYHLNLTRLYMMDGYIPNLSMLTKLNTLTFINIKFKDLINFWNNHLLHLSNLSYLYLSKSSIYEDNLGKKGTNDIFDCRCLSNAINLKFLKGDIKLNYLNISDAICDLSIPYRESYNHHISKLTRLTNLNFTDGLNSYSKLNLAKLTRLYHYYERSDTVTEPEIKIV